MNDEGGRPERIDAPERMDAIEQYVERACGRLGLGSILKEHLRDEIRGHLLEAIEAHVARGMPRDEAAASAIEEFGDPGDVAEGLKAVYGRHAVRLLIEKAMEWKERTMKSGWKWSFIAHFMLGLLIVAETLLILGTAVYIFPVIEMEHRDLGLPLPYYWPMTLKVLGLMYDWGWLMIVLAALAIGVFEWRYRGDNKPFVRLALGGVVAVVLMGLVWAVGFASTVPLVQLRVQLVYSSAAVMIERNAIKAEDAYQEIMQALAAEQPEKAAAATHRLHSAMRDIERTWTRAYGLAALDRKNELDSIRDVVREVMNCADDMSGPQTATLTAEERKKGWERLRSACERLRSAVGWWPKASREPMAPSGEKR